jgi:tetratricopeptide (TPR) repeat protein
MNQRIITLLAVGAILIGGTLVGLALLRQDQRPEDAVPTRQAPVVAGADAGKLDYIRKAEAIVDPLERCKAYPAPTGFEWPRELTDALCTDLLSPRLTTRQAEAWIEDGEAEELDRYLDSLVDGYFKGTVPEGVLWLAYSSKFEVGGAETRSLLDQWVTQRPDSGHAQLALASHHLTEAWGFRGSKFYDDMPQADQLRMQEEVDAAVAAAELAIKLEPRLIPAYAIAMRVSQIGGDDDIAARMSKDGLAVKPDSYLLRDASMFPLHWGGSPRKLDAIAADGMRHIASNPRMPLLTAFAKATRALAEHREGRHKEAVPLFEAALAIAPDRDHLYWGSYSQSQAGDPARAVEYLSQVIRFAPRHSNAITSRARHLVKLGQTNWALADLERLVAEDYNANVDALSQYISILQRAGRNDEAEAKLKLLLVANPQDRWINRQLGRIYLYRLRRYPEAKVHIDTMLASDPADGAALLMQLDYLQNTNAPSLRAAAEKFVAHADQDDADQKNAYPKVVAWLANAENK